MKDTLIPDGIYPGISADKYFHSPEWSGRMSPSVLDRGVKQTMSHVRAAFYGELSTETDALDFGKAFHSRLLEPDLFKTQFAVAQQCCANTEKKKRCSKMGVMRCGDGEWYCTTHAPDAPSQVEVLSPATSEIIEAMRRKVFAHPAVALLRAGGSCECCIAWTDPKTGVKCKSRLDKYSPVCELPDGQAGAMILDLKSCRAADPHSLSNAMEEHGWARAAAMRCDGVEVLTGVRPDYTLIAIEKSAPYEVAVVTIGEQTRDGARAEVRSLLDVWANCLKTGFYPGYSDDFIELDAPGWKLHEYRETAKILMEA